MAALTCVSNPAHNSKWLPASAVKPRMHQNLWFTHTSSGDAAAQESYWHRDVLVTTQSCNPQQNLQFQSEANHIADGSPHQMLASSVSNSGTLLMM